MKLALFAIVALISSSVVFLLVLAAVNSYWNVYARKVARMSNDELLQEERNLDERILRGNRRLICRKYEIVSDEIFRRKL